MNEEEQAARGEAIVAEAKAHFEPLGLDCRRLVFPRETSVGFRPGRVGDPVIEIGDKVAVVTGFGGQGIVTSPAVAKLVAGKINDRLPKSGVYSPHVGEHD